MPRTKGPRGLSVEDVESIESLARLLRKILEIHDQAAPNVLLAFEQLRKIFPRLRLRTVPDFSLQKPARSHPANWTIRIRQSVYEALLRGQGLARWTLCHEIAHILRAHPGKPFREEIGKRRKNWKEREANVFVRQFLIPPHLAATCRTVEDVSRLFQVSLDAAEIALFEQRTEHFKTTSNSDGIRAQIQAKRTRLGYSSSLEDQAAAVFCAISQTIGEASALSIPAESFKNNPLSVCPGSY
jgi:Zn-dependent peptidase ImmA (M78 family)